MQRPHPPKHPQEDVTLDVDALTEVLAEAGLSPDDQVGCVRVLLISAAG
jgi:hypothetical protein